jgi:ribonuclease J
MKLKIHRGTNEIGANCIEITNLSKEKILIDVGYPLDEIKEDYTKKITKVINNNISGILISHSHLDHYGLLEKLEDKSLVYIDDTASKMINISYAYNRKKPLVEKHHRIEHKKSFKIGNFKITPYLCDHSAYGAYSFLIEADNKKLFYSGDFRSHGRKQTKYYELIKNPPKNIDLLVMEGTCINKDSKAKKEKELENDFYNNLSKSKALNLIMFSSQNIDRIVTIYKTILKLKKTLILDFYTAMILEGIDNSNIPKFDWNNIRVYLPKVQKTKVIREKLFKDINQFKSKRIFKEEISKNPEKYLMLFRPSMFKDIEDFNLSKKPNLIYSMWKGYIDEKLKNWIDENTSNFEHIHTSGHADLDALKKYTKSLNPRILVPIHTENKEKFISCFENVKILNDEESFTL